MKIDQKTKVEALKEECRLARQAGLEVTLTVRNTSKLGSPTRPPESLSLYEYKLESIIEKCHPALLLVEYKESSDLYYGGSVEEYEKQLSRAVSIIHSRGVLCANGGIEGELVSLYLYQSYLDRGLKSQAERFLAQAFDETKRQLFASEYFQEIMFSSVHRVKEFIRVYRSQPIDYVNLHWSQDSAEAFGQVVNFLRKLTGKQVISSEIKFPQDEQKAHFLMKKVSRLGIPCAIWYFGVEDSSASAVLQKEGLSYNLAKKFKNFTRFRYRGSARLRHGAFHWPHAFSKFIHFFGGHSQKLAASMWAPALLTRV